ncbi:hypothetical protein L551_0849 [Bordetella pertussis STO1-SEAT-0004]|nr:hypothetical protein L551_0849 [Bordetella pertussis STO1-SEAT-0004]
MRGARGAPRGEAAAPRCEDSIGCMHGSSEPDLRNWTLYPSPDSTWTNTTY